MHHFVFQQMNAFNIIPGFCFYLKINRRRDIKLKGYFFVSLWL